MIKAKQDEKELVKRLASQSFKDIQNVNYIIRKDKNQLRTIWALMDIRLGLKKTK
jgi:ABC-type transporter MlaC component